MFILEYHDVTRGQEREGVISVKRFHRHLRFLKRHYHLASLGDAVEILASSEPIGRDVVVITLDDGYLGNYKCALPVLRQEAVPATVFLASSFLDGSELWFEAARTCLGQARKLGTRLPAGLRLELKRVLGNWPPPNGIARAAATLKYIEPQRRRHLLDELRSTCTLASPRAQSLSWEQVRSMAAAGVEIGCHTVSHPILSMLARDHQEKEILVSRDRISVETGITPRLFAYPNGAPGDFNAETIDILRSAGFTAACTTVRGSNKPGCDPFTLKRLGVGSDPCFLLRARLAGIFDTSIRARLALTSPGGAQARVHRNMSSCAT